MDIKSAMEMAGTPYFLMAGTVLGFHRDGDFLPGDKDIDIGVLPGSFQRKSILDQFRSHPLFQVSVVDAHAERIRLKHVNGCWIDIFPFWEEAGKWWHAGTVAKWSHEPFTLTTMNVFGTDYPVPSTPESHLINCYGPSWDRPDSLFDVYVDAPNATITHQEHFDLSLRKKVLDALKTGSSEKLRKYAPYLPDLPFLLS